MSKQPNSGPRRSSKTESRTASSASEIDISAKILEAINSHRTKSQESIKETCSYEGFDKKEYQESFYKASLELAKLGDIEGLKILSILGNFDLGFKVSALRSTTLLHEAIMAGQIEVVKFLIDEIGLKPDHCLLRSDDKLFPDCSPLFYAVANNKNDIAEFLIKKGANFESDTLNEVDLIKLATKRFNFGIIKTLMQFLGSARCQEIMHSKIKLENVNFNLFGYINAQSPKGRRFSPEKEAQIQDEKLQLVEFLLKNGINPNLIFENGITPLYFSVVNDDYKLTELLIKYGANVEELLKIGEFTDYQTRDAKGKVRVERRTSYLLYNALGIAAKTSSLDSFRLLFRQGANAAQDLKCDSTIEFNASSDQEPSRGLEKLQYLKRRGADFNRLSIDPQIQNDKIAPLHRMAMITGGEESVKFLLNSGADPETLSQTRFNALFFAFRNSQCNSLKEIAKANGIPEGGIESGFSPLLSLTQSGLDVDLFRFLLCNGADLALVENRAKRNLENLLLQNPENKELKAKIEQISELIHVFSKQTPGVLTKDSKSALHLIAEFGNCQTFLSYIQNRGDIERKDKKGEDPLDIALRAKNYKIVREILDLALQAPEGAAKYDLNEMASKKPPELKKQQYELIRALFPLIEFEKSKSIMRDKFLKAAKSGDSEDVKFFLENEKFGCRETAQEAFDLALKNNKAAIANLLFVKGYANYTETQDEQRAADGQNLALFKMLHSKFSDPKNASDIENIVEVASQEMAKIFLAKVNQEFLALALKTAAAKGKKEIAEFCISKIEKENQESALGEAIKAAKESKQCDLAFDLCRLNDSVKEKYFIDLYDFVEKEVELNESEVELFRRNFLRYDRLDRKIHFANFFLTDQRLKNRNEIVANILPEIKEQFSKKTKSQKREKSERNLIHFILNGVSRKGNIDSLKALQQNFPEFFNPYDKNLEAFFNEAFIAQNYEAIEFLESVLGPYFKESEQSENKRLELISLAAIRKNDPRILQWLFAKADFSAIFAKKGQKNSEKKDKLASALRSFLYRDIEGAKMMLECKADPNFPVRSSGKNDIVHIDEAGSRGNLEALKLLINFGVDASDNKTLTEYFIHKKDMQALYLFLANDAQLPEEIIQNISPKAVQIQIEVFNHQRSHDESGNSLLHLQAGFGSKKSITRLLDKLKESGELAGAINSVNNYGSTPLYCAIEEENYEAAEILIAYGADINFFNQKSGWAPIYIAALKLQTGLVLKFLEKGASLNHKDLNHDYSFFAGFLNDPLMPLISKPEIRQQAIEILKILMANGACAKTNTNFDYSLLFGIDSSPEIKEVVEVFFDPTKRTKEGESRVDLVKKYGVSKRRPDWEDLKLEENRQACATALQKTLRGFNARSEMKAKTKESNETKEKVTQFLTQTESAQTKYLQQNELLAKKDEELYSKAKKEDKAARIIQEYVRDFFEARQAKEAQNQAKQEFELKESMHQRRNIQAQNFLHAKPRNIVEQELIDALATEEPQKIKEFLLQSNINLSHILQNGKSILHYLSPNILTKINVAEFSLNSQNSRNNTALDEAALDPNLFQAFKTLIDLGANPYHNHPSILFNAAISNNSQALNILICKKEVDLTAKNKNGENIFQFLKNNNLEEQFKRTQKIACDFIYELCCNNKIQGIEALIEAGADLGFLEKNLRMEIFYYAISRSEAFLCEQLIIAGCDVNHIDKNGNTALDFAINFGSDPKIFKLLVDHGGKLKEELQRPPSNTPEEARNEARSALNSRQNSPIPL